MSYFAHLIKSLIHQGLHSFTPQLKIHVYRHFASYKTTDCLVIIGNDSLSCKWEMNRISWAKHKKMPWLFVWHELAGRSVPVLSALMSWSSLHPLLNAMQNVCCQSSVSKPSCISESLPTISINWVGIIDEMRVKVKLTAQKKKKKVRVRQRIGVWQLNPGN